jgi:endonuclease YncB( thermonuclease family)
MAMTSPPPRARGISRPRVAWARVLAAAAVLAVLPKYAAAITVLDANTFLLSPGKKIRLFDIVTPSSARCGCIAECLLAQRAQTFLQTTLSRAAEEVRVNSFGADADGATRAKVFVNSRNLSMLMIQNGFARPAMGAGDIKWCPG